MAGGRGDGSGPPPGPSPHLRPRSSRRLFLGSVTRPSLKPGSPAPGFPPASSREHTPPRGWGRARGLRGNGRRAALLRLRLRGWPRGGSRWLAVFAGFRGASSPAGPGVTPHPLPHPPPDSRVTRARTLPTHSMGPALTQVARERTPTPILNTSAVGARPGPLVPCCVPGAWNTMDARHVFAE